MPIDPYTPPALEPESLPVESEEETIRRVHLLRESLVRNLASLYFAGFICFVIGIIGSMMSGPRGFREWIMAGGLSGIALLFLWTAYRLLVFSPRSRLSATILAAFWLVGFPVGTCLGLYALLVLHLGKGRRLFTADYREIITRTGHLRTRPRILLGLVTILLGAPLAFIATALASRILFGPGL